MTTTPEQAPDEVAAVDERGGNDADQEAALAVRNLTKTFEDGDESVQAVDDVSLAIQPGTVVGVLGPNGAGKTTLIKSILGLVIADEGDVSVAGTDVYADPRAAYARVGAMLEGARNVYWKLTVQENFEFFAAVGGESPNGLADRHEDLLDQLSLREKGDTPVNDLSRGQKQKVSLACALARDVDVAFLDEPTLGLDVESSVELRGEIRRLADQEDMTIVLSSHNMDVVQDVCDRVVIMNDGAVIADDAVADLIDVFRTFTYRVVVGADEDPDGIEAGATEQVLDSAARDRLADAYGVETFESRGETTAFDVSLGDPERFYDLIDDLREAGVTVREVESVDPDLEEVFLELTNGGGGGTRLDAGANGGGQP